MAGFYLPNYSMADTPYGMSNTSPGTSFNMPQSATGMTPDQLRLAQLNQNMQPNTFLPYLNAGIQGASTLGNLFFAWQGMRGAQQDAAWQRGMADKNYWNSVKSYNTAVEDRVRSRYSPGSAERNQGTINTEIQRRQIGGG